MTGFVGRDVAGRFIAPDDFVRALTDAAADDTPQRVYLTRDLSAWSLVDGDDFPCVSRFLWHRHRDGKGKQYARGRCTVNGFRGVFYLHRVVMVGVPRPSRRHVLVDHINGDGLDNRKANLRWATPSENGRNRYGFLAGQFDLFRTGRPI